MLDASQSPTDDHDDAEMVARSARASPRSPASALLVESTSAADLAAENARTLRLLDSMFGEADEDWGGAESIDSDMEQAATATKSRANAVPDASESSHNAIADFEVVPAAQRRAGDKSSVERRTQQTATIAPRNHGPDPDPAQQPSTKLKDLFAPREEEGFSLIGHLDLDSELEHDSDEPAFAHNANAPAPVTAPIPISASDPTTTTTARSAVAPPPPTRAQQAQGLDATLPFFFPHSSRAEGRHRLRGAVEFGRTEDEAQIRARWESVRGELTREWKRRHREAVKSSRRRGRGGAGGERVE
jgi:hypothetical protein